MTIQGRRYYAFDLMKRAIYPNKVGNLEISSGRVSVMINPFEGNKVLTSQAININVLPLPLENKPDSFSGAVGDFFLDAKISTSSVEVNASYIHENYYKRTREF